MQYLVVLPCQLNGEDLWCQAVHPVTDLVQPPAAACAHAWHSAETVQRPTDLLKHALCWRKGAKLVMTAKDNVAPAKAHVCT